MTLFHRAHDVTTRTMIIASLLVVVLAFVLEAVETVLFPHAQPLRAALEKSSTFAFWSGYIALLATIPISVFRPLNRFSLHGDCRARGRNFLLGIGLSVLVTLGVAILVAQAL